MSFWVRRGRWGREGTEQTNWNSSTKCLDKNLSTKQVPNSGRSVVRCVVWWCYVRWGNLGEVLHLQSNFVDVLDSKQFFIRLMRGLFFSKMAPGLRLSSGNERDWEDCPVQVWPPCPMESHVSKFPANSAWRIKGEWLARGALLSPEKSLFSGLRLTLKALGVQEMLRMYISLRCVVRHNWFSFC